MKIAFLSGGAREQALCYILDKGVHVGVVITPYFSKGNKRFKGVVEVALEYGVPVFPVRKDGLYNALQNFDYDLIVSCGFPYLININEIKCKKAINVHPTLLPKYRGFRSGSHVLINGETKSGVTIHYITDEMDRGDILAQAEFKLTFFDTIKSMMRKACEIEGKLLYSVIQNFKNNEFEGKLQDESAASEYLKLRTPEDSEIDWNKPLKELYNEIRACDPDEYPAHFYVDGEKVCIKLWRSQKSENEYDMI